MAYITGPDFSDSDFSDDDYVSYGEKPKKINYKQEPKTLTEQEKKDQQKSQLYNYICSGNVELVIEYIDENLDVNIILQNNWTPLLLSVSSGNAKLSEELLKRRADPNSTRDGCTALMMACNCPKETSPYTESLKIIKLLVKEGANVKATNRKRMTALMFAANMGNLPVVKYLLPLSDKNAEDNQKWTALFWAINGNEVSVVKYLLEENLDYSSADVRNNTPLDIAKANDFTDVLDLFPHEETDEIYNIIDNSILSFEEIFSQLKKVKEPDFFIDICNMLCGMKSEATIKNLSDKNINLKDFLSITEAELENLGVKMPYQRYRILAGIYKFHKHPFHPRSLHVVPLNETYSNIDVGIQLLSAIKQIMVMEAGLQYIMKHSDMEDISDDELTVLRRNVDKIKKNIKLCSMVTKKISERTKMWDKQREPVDLISKSSRKYNWPWRKIIFSVSIISLICIFHLRK